MCAGALFVESRPVPPELKKLCAILLCPASTEMNYMTRRSHRMQKYKFGVMCPGALFVEFALVPLEHEK
jgi:hypothetical protein